MELPPFPSNVRRHNLTTGFLDNSVGRLASGQGKQDRNQWNGLQRASANIGRRVATVNMRRMSQQRSNGNGSDRKRDNVTDARIERFLKTRSPHTQLISRAFCRQDGLQHFNIGRLLDRARCIAQVG